MRRDEVIEMFDFVALQCIEDDLGFARVTGINQDAFPRR